MFFIKEDGGKKTIQKKNVGMVVFPVVAVAVSLGMLRGKEDTSFMKETSRKLSPQDGQAGTQGSPGQPTGVRGVREEATDDTANRGQRGGRHSSNAGGGPPLKYRAVQVIERQGGDPDRKLPIGTSFIGQLLTAIDTREQNSFVKVLLPYGAAFDRDRRIERNSTLFGTVNYPGTGDKVYIKFNRVLSPDGKEFKIEAQALNAQDYSPGLAGESHDGAGGRIATTTGLTMLSGMSDVLVEKQVSGGFNPTTTPKSTMRNAFFNGLTKSTQREAERQAEKITQQKDYVTIEAGEDIIISLTETFNGESK